MSTPLEAQKRVSPLHECTPAGGGPSSLSSTNSTVHDELEKHTSNISRFSSSSHLRSNSDSPLIDTASAAAHPLNRLSPNGRTDTPYPASSLDLPADLPRSFRTRVRSFNAGRDTTKEQSVESSPARNGNELSSWWNKIETLPRPWGHEGTDDSDIPEGHKEGWEVTRKCVAQAAVSVLGTTGLVVKEVLVTGLQLANFVPIPGLQSVATTLLKIWDAVQLVGTNRLAFLRLTQRCANAVLSIRQEIEDSGKRTTEELLQPIDTLDRVFGSVLVLTQQQSGVPFLMRYLKRNEIVSRIADLNKDVIDALQMFGISVQIRTMKLIQLNEENRQADTRLIKSFIAAQMPSGLSSSPGRRAALNAPNRLPSPTHDSSPVVPSIHDLYATENSRDTQRDMDDLRQLMRVALRTGSDSEMISFLQIAREEMPEAIKSLQRALEIVAHSNPSVCINGNEENSKEKENDLLLHREFIESGIDALRRMSKGLETELPSWTITKYEVEPEHKIGVGFFSDVYKGTWKGRSVAIKVLAEPTPRKLFVREMAIWKTLRHQNVAELYGASSASGDPPWFFVSPYEKNGNLVDYMRRCILWKEKRRPGAKDKSIILKERDLYRFMNEIAEGMAYLHARGILHGDLKACNVLVDDDVHCVISDFGQSELKSEVYRISGVPFPGGALRWQAPELLQGHGELTSAADIYAYAISCIEVLNLGQLPWPSCDDDAVRYLVLKESSRPRIPASCTVREMQELIRLCWDSMPERRPSFAHIVLEQQWMIQAMGREETTAMSQRFQTRASEAEEYFVTRSKGLSSLSPSLIPMSPEVEEQLKDIGRSVFHVPQEEDTPPITPYISKRENLVVNTENLEPQSVIFSPSVPGSPASSSFRTEDTSQEHVTHVGVHSTSSPADRRGIEARNERTYRISLDRKEYHSSLSLPLWDPTFIELGDVGYLSKPTGAFVTLFNAFKPFETSNGLTADMPSVAGYGPVLTGFQKRSDRRTAAQKGLDAFAGLLMFGKGRTHVPVSRRYSFALRTGLKSTYLCTEGTEYQYLKALEAPKQWFRAHVDTILHLYGAEHSLQREDLLLVIGALQATNYGLFVGHNYPDGQAHFNVFTSAKRGEPWGAFTTDAYGPEDEGNGPNYFELQNVVPSSASKVSQVGDPPRSVLLARLRFKPDVMEPTSL